MNTSLRVLIQGALLLPLLLTGCKKAEQPTNTPETGGGEPATVDAPADSADQGGERAKLSRAECEGQGGQIVGDIGDGAIHRPDYVCASGKPPLGSIAPGEGEPIATEGEVCCPG